MDTDVQDTGGATTALAPERGRALGSDPHAFASLYIRHRASFTSHARRYLRDPRDADEVVQEAFLRLFLAMPELETELQALAYCRRTITNLCIDRYRADARRPRLVALEGPTVDELAETDTGDPVVRAEDAALVRQALSQLPPLHRAALVKREIEEKPLPVIADELDVAEDSVKHLLFRARRALRKLLAGTAVAPGVDVELTRGLRPAARGLSGGAAGLLLLALLGLGSGPDLRAVPVVGVDLPDVLGVTTVADAVGDAVRGAVSAVTPRRDAHAAPRTAGDPPSRSATGEQAVPGTDRSAPSAAQAQPGQPTSSAVRAPAAAPGPAAVPGLTAPAQPTRVVTVVDGVPVVRLVPPAIDAPTASAPVVGARPTTPGISAGRESGPRFPNAAPVFPGGAGRDLPAAAPGRALVPAVTPPTASNGSVAPDRTPTVEDVAPKPAKASDKAEKAADKAERAEDKAQRPAEKAADAADRSADKGERAADRTADKVKQSVDKSADKAEKAADKMERAVETAAADKPGKGPAKVVEKAAERAAARMAEVTEAPVAERAVPVVPAP